MIILNWRRNVRILFWNTNRNKINQYIADVVRDYNIDVLIMAEYEDGKNDWEICYSHIISR